MKVRLGAAAALAALALTACSSSTSGSGDPFDSTTGGAGSTSSGAGGGGSSATFCSKLEQAQTKLGQISTSMSDPSKAKQVLTEQAALFADLDKSAPAAIKATIHDLATVIRAGADYFANPGAGSPAALADLATKLPQDIGQLSSYVEANCH
jgi:hypothetical protein